MLLMLPHATASLAQRNLWLALRQVFDLRSFSHRLNKWLTTSQRLAAALKLKTKTHQIHPAQQVPEYLTLKLRFAYQR
jgi:hypothetical protein